MEGFQIPTDELRKAAHEFSEVGKESGKLIERLSKATGDLEKTWAGAPKQMFFKHYIEWNKQMEGYAALLEQIAKQMEAIAERFEQADK